MPGTRIELVTRGFSIHCSTTELPRQLYLFIYIYKYNITNYNIKASILFFKDPNTFY
jgi:hypothetical protein